MLSQNRHRHPTVPAIEANIESACFDASRSFTNTTPPSSIQSSFEAANSADSATSVSDREESADVSITTLRSSSKMAPKATIDQAAAQIPNNEGRRASGRVRKPTAKAVALNGSRSYSPPLEDTIIISSSSTRRRSSNKDRSPESTKEENPFQDIRIQLDIPITPNGAKAADSKIPSPENVAQDTPPAIIVDAAPSRRQSLRERKPTAKVLSESAASQKHSADETAENAPVRKSTRSSYAKVPSKLRYSVSAEQSEVEDDEKMEIVENVEPKRSHIVVLKYTPKSDTAAASHLQRKEEVRSQRSASKKAKRAHRNATTTTTVPTFTAPETRTPGSHAPVSCDLSCLDGPSRLLAFAEIALQMPSDDDDFRKYVSGQCQCGPRQRVKIDRTNSAELARALLPNTLSSGTKHDPIVVSPGNRPDTEAPAARVDKTPRPTSAATFSNPFGFWNGMHPPGPPSMRQSASEPYDSTRPPSASSAPSSYTGIRDSADTLYNGTRSPTLGPALGPYPNFTRSADKVYSANRLMPPGPPRDSYTGIKRCADEDSESIGQPPAKRVATNTSVSPHIPAPRRGSFFAGSEEDYLRAQARRELDARGIPWDYNMSLYEIQELVERAVNGEQQAQYRRQSLTKGAEWANDADERPSPSGFGVLLPPKGSTFIQRSTHSTDGVAGAGTAGLGKISFVNENNPANPANDNRQPSPARPKSSRFRVDPRGLRGEDPGPGTIINMAEKKAERQHKAAKEARARQ